MDKEVLQDLYDRAKSKGYSKSIEEFEQLIGSDQDVLNDNFEYVQSKGYKKDINSFSTLSSCCCKFFDCSTLTSKA